MLLLDFSRWALLECESQVLTLDTSITLGEKGSIALPVIPTG